MPYKNIEYRRAYNGQWNKTYYENNPEYKWILYDANKDKYLDKAKNWSINNQEKRHQIVEKNNRNPEVIKRRKLMRLSLELVRDGSINIPFVCSCGSTEDLRLYHKDYEDATHVAYKCHVCFWNEIRSRNRSEKISK